MGWTRCSDDLPPAQGLYLVFDEREVNMWVAAWADGSGVDTWGDRRPMGWSEPNPKLWPTHWMPLPAPPSGAEKE